MKKVLIPRDVHESGKDYLRERGYTLVMGSGYSEEIMAREIVDCDAVLARTAPYTDAVISAGKKLKIIARMGVGYETVDVDSATRHGVYVTVAKNINANAVAEHTLMLILALAKHTVANNEACRRGDWAIRERDRTEEIRGRKLGIIGLGSIGRLIAQKAHMGFDMEIVGADAFADWIGMPEYIAQSDIDGVFRQADIVSLNVPLTPETRGMACSARFDGMKKGAWLLNTSRGGVVSESDLYDALVSGQVGAAALDVFEHEPASLDNRLFSLPNFVASPHCAGLSEESEENMCLSCAAAIDDVLNGRRPQYPINEPLREDGENA